MSQLRALRDKRAGIIRTSSELFAALDKEGRVMTAEEIAAEDARAAEVAAIDESIRRAEQHADRMRAAGGTGAQDTQSGERFSNLGQMLLSVAKQSRPESGFKDPRLVWTNGTGIAAGPTGLGEGVDADGGFLVQQDLVSELLTPMWNTGEIASRVRRISVGPNANGVVMNGVDETSRANGSRWGGVRAYWTGEAALITASQPKFRQIKMELEKLTALCYATSEMLQDSTVLNSVISQAFREEMTFKFEDGIFNGSGAGMPQGILNSGCVITVSKEGSQAAATVLAQNIVKMWARMPARLRGNSAWYINQDVEPQLFQLSIPVKNVASTENVGGFQSPPVIYVPPGTAGNQYGLLMGRPVIPVEYCATLGTAGDIILGDLSTYLAIDKNGIDAQTSIHVRFLYDEMAFRFIYRANGQPIWNSAITPYKGSNTLSPFIVLETR